MLEPDAPPPQHLLNCSVRRGFGAHLILLMRYRQTVDSVLVRLLGFSLFNSSSVQENRVSVWLQRCVQQRLL